MSFNNVTLHNAGEFAKHPRTGELAISRIPDSLRVHMNDLLKNETAFDCAGVELRFKINSGKVKINLQLLNLCEENEVVYDTVYVFMGGFQLSKVFYVSNKPSEIVIDTSAYEKSMMEVIAEKDNSPWSVDVVRVVLPYGSHVKLNSIEGDISPITDEKVPSMKWSCVFFF